MVFFAHTRAEELRRSVTKENFKSKDFIYAIKELCTKELVKLET